MALVERLQSLLVVVIFMMTIEESISEIAVNIDYEDNEVDLPTLETNLHNAGNLAPTGMLTVLSTLGELYTVDLSQSIDSSTDSSFIIKHQFLRKGTNSTSNPFFATQETEGSAATTLQPFPALNHDNTVYHVFHHHAYIAYNNDIIILNLSPGQTTLEGVHAAAEYLTLQFNEKNISQIQAYNIRGEHYISVFYMNGERGYARLFRRYSDGMWGLYGAPDLVTSPGWFSNPRLLSNVLFYQPPGPDNRGDSINVAVGYEYYLNNDDLLERSYFSEIIPTPCNNVEYLTYNKPSHLMFIVCNEASFFFNATTREFYDHGASLDGVSGKPYFNHNAKFVAVVCNSSEEASNVTIIHIVKQSSTIAHHLTDSLIAQATFVDVGPSKRYFCYLEIGLQTGLKCIDIKATFSSQNNGTVVVREVPNSKGLCPNETSSCPPLYTHHNLLIAQNCTNDNECEDGVRAFDLETFTNVWNLTGIEPILMQWRPVTRQPPSTSTTTTTEATTETLLNTATTESQTTMQAETVSQTTTITKLPTEATQPPSNSIYVTTVTHLNASTSVPITLEVCQAQLASANDDYNRLLWITIGICVFFCVALAATVVLVIAVISVNRMGSNSTTDNVTKKKAPTKKVPDRNSITTKSAV